MSMFRMPMGPAFLAITLTLGGCSTGAAPSPDEPNVSDKGLPPLRHGGDCHRVAQEVETREWLQAADAIVVGEVSDVRGVVDPGRLRQDGVVRLVPQEECRIVQGVFEVTLTNVQVLSGSVPSEVIARFDYGVETSWTSYPVVLQDGSTYWTDDAEGVVVPGMRIGGALFRVEGVEFYTFMSGRFQPIFEVDDEDRVRFQQFREPCVDYVGPARELSGLTLAGLALVIDAAKQEEFLGSREDNRLRQALRLDETPDDIRLSHYGLCKGDIVPHGETCDFDWDCPSGQICSEAFDCQDE